ncbi:hypothetical protein JW988_07055 [Candidatus Bathyarchaeota archaeon]|nr:hypothetical protein [Candidatus Bathyarchaeota archaeon]
MIPNLNEIIIIITTTTILILLMFLPAFIELKKPKDKGPRIITLEKNDANNSITPFSSITNIEDHQKFDNSLIQTMLKIIDFLPSLEV